MNPYTEYVLTHWEEGDTPVKTLIVKEGRVSVTPETVHSLLKSFFPIGYREGEITLDIPIGDFLAFWKQLGGDYGVKP